MNAPDFIDQRSQVERLFTPEWAGGWFLVRWLWVLAALLEHAWRVTAIEDAFAPPDMVFVSAAWRLADYFYLEPTGAYALWAGTMVGIGMVAWGGRLLKPGLILFMICGWTLGAYEALNVKAHDRLLVWVSLGLFFSPADQSNLTTKYRSPYGRMLMMTAFAGIYGCTGFAKAMNDPSWFYNGQVLGLHFLDDNHGGSDLAVWMSDQTWILWPSAVITVLWELTYPLAIWFKKLNPWYLLVGGIFHLVLLLTMQVGPFAFVAMAAYPALLHPEVAREWWFKFEAYRQKRRSS